ncbi:MAG: CDP-alcohol phosphatidyltransferase family protein [Anaerolineales bacterium]
MSVGWLPAALVLFRFLIGPVLLWHSLHGETGPVVAIGMAAGLFSDIVDGFIARWLNVFTQRLRIWDSRVDLFFFLCLASSAWIAHSHELLPHLKWIFAMLIAYAISLIYPLLKFRRAPAYHAVSAKLAGIALFLAAWFLFLTGDAGIFFDIAMAITIVSHIDRIAITYLLSEWRTDVAGFWKVL